MGDSGDYIFTKGPDGKLEFKGDFEGLYRADPDPWGQSGEHPRMKEYYAYSRSRLVGALHGLDEPGPGIGWMQAMEVGCGRGHVTRFLNDSFVNRRVEGMDISRSAVGRAETDYPDLHFWLGDIGAPGIGHVFMGRYDAVILNQALWYVLHRLSNTFRNVGRMLKPHGHLIIQTAFLDEQEYGKEIVNGFNGLLWYVLDHHGRDYQVVSASYDNSSRHAPYHDGLLVLQATC